jgi:hypothetical protein
VNRSRQLISTYDDMAELIRLGAYRQGSDIQVDEAIHYYPALEEFMRQTKDENTDLEGCYQRLAECLDMTYQPESEEPVEAMPGVIAEPDAAMVPAVPEMPAAPEMPPPPPMPEMPLTPAAQPEPSAAQPEPSAAQPEPSAAPPEPQVDLDILPPMEPVISDTLPPPAPAAEQGAAGSGTLGDAMERAEKFAQKHLDG